MSTMDENLTALYGNCSYMYRAFFNETSGRIEYREAQCVPSEYFIPSSGSFVNAVKHRYFFPVIFLVGVLGNALNLCVLNNKSMRSKTNLFLSALACSDLLMLVVITPLTFDKHEIIVETRGYIAFYYHAHILLIAVVNWLLTASIWLTLGVTVERTVAVKFPIHAKIFWKRRRLVTSIVCIFVLSFLLNSFHFWIRTVEKAPVCKKCGVFSYKWKHVDPKTSPRAHMLAEISIMASALLSVFVPLVLLIILNCILVHDLRKNSRFMMSGTGTDDRRSQNNAQKVKANERKVTIMVVVIIASFIVLNIPSGIIYAYDMILGLSKRKEKIFYELAEVANMLLLLSKVVNFILYCLSSENFRRHLLCLLCKSDTFLYKILRKSHRMRYSMQQSMNKRQEDNIDELSDATTNVQSLSNSDISGSVHLPQSRRVPSVVRFNAAGDSASLGKKPFGASTCQFPSVNLIRNSTKPGNKCTNVVKRTSLEEGPNNAKTTMACNRNGGHHLGRNDLLKPEHIHLMSPKKFHSLSNLSTAEAMSPLQPDEAIAANLLESASLTSGRHHHASHYPQRSSINQPHEYQRLKTAEGETLL